MYNKDFQKLQSKAIAYSSSAVIKEGSKIEPLKIKKVANPNDFVANDTVPFKPPPFPGLKPRIPSKVIQPVDVLPPPNRANFVNTTYSNRRDASGKILGAPKRRYIDPSLVPYTFNTGNFAGTGTLSIKDPSNNLAADASNSSAESTAGSSNSPWITCFDEEVGAHYYYNELTGEATWIPPENV